VDIGIGIGNTLLDMDGRTLIGWAQRAEARGFASLASIGRVAWPLVWLGMRVEADRAAIARDRRDAEDPEASEWAEELARIPELTRIHELNVAAVVEAPGGAHPSYAHGYSVRDNAFYAAWDPISRDRDAFVEWMRRNVLDLVPSPR